MKSIFLFLFSFFVLADDWDSKFAEVCKRDKFCSRLKASDGTWLRPKSEIIALLKDAEVQKEIKAAAAKYKVDPTAIAGAIVAENSLNVGVKDSVQTWLAGKMGVTQIAGKNFSFGLGQIQLPAAREAEDHIAKIEKRTPRSDSELTQEISDPMGSIRIAASIVRKVQDDYKNQGFDISKDPGVLTTLYNLGKSEKRAAEAKSAGRLPEVNYFGLFVDKYTPEIRTSAKLGQASTKTIASIAAPAAVVTTNKTGNSELATSGATSKPEVQVSTKNFVKMDTVTKSVPLLSAPLLCETTEYGQDVARETKSASFGAPVGVLDKDETFTEASRTLDCKSNIWKLVKGKEAKAGWVQDEQLEKARSTKLEAPLKCTPSRADIICRKNLEKTIGDLAVESKKTPEGLIFLKPVSSSYKNIKISFKNEDFNCNYKMPETKDSNSSVTNSNLINNSSNYPSVQNLNGYNKSDLSTKQLAEETQSLSKYISSELLRMSAETKIPIEDLSEPDNPYNSIAQILTRTKQGLTECLRSISSEVTMCEDPKIYSKEYKDILSQFKYIDQPELSTINTFSSDLVTFQRKKSARSNNYVSFNNYTPDDVEIASTPIIDIKESLADCQTRIQDLEKTAAVNKIQQQNQIQTGSVMPSVQTSTSNGVTQTVTMTATSVAYSFGYGFPGNNRSRNSGYNSIVSSDDVFKASAKATDDQYKKYAGEFLGYAKFCHARLNLIEKNKTQNKINCTSATKYLRSSNDYQMFSKEMAAKIYEKDPLILSDEIKEGTSKFISKSTMNDILGVAPQAARQPYSQPMEDYRSSYCPNKTAEYIEDLVKANPCIKHVYVPTRYLSNKLNSIDSKVIYRQFEQDGKYAIEIGEPVCK